MYRKYRDENTHGGNSPEAELWHIQSRKSLEPDLVGKEGGLEERRGRELSGGQALAVQVKALNLGSCTWVVHE